MSLSWSGLKGPRYVVCLDHCESIGSLDAKSNQYSDPFRVFSQLTDFDHSDESSRAENLAILEIASRATLAQLFDVGVMHADPHSGNLVKVPLGIDSKSGERRVMLGYLDYGMVSTLPEPVRDGLVCATAQMVFARNTEAVALMFKELRLLKQETLDDPVERKALIAALDNLLKEVFIFPEEAAADGTRIPRLKFDRLLGGLSMLVARFEFELPPYVWNHCCAHADLQRIELHNMFLPDLLFPSLWHTIDSS